MIYETPPVDKLDQAVLDEIEALRTRLRYFLREPRRWYGTVRRATLARAIQGSNSIEGYHASVSDVAAVIEDEPPLEADEETRQAIEGYRDAMTYLLQLAAAPPMPPLDDSLVKSLHFMMLKYDLTKHPGQWRPGSVWVEDQDGNTVYDAPARDELETLIAELLAAVNDGSGNPIVRASMAHLNLALIHPFSDGNGRMARCLQSYVLAGEGVLSPEFLSIEEYLGRNTISYYGVLTEVAKGKWTPSRDAHPWLRYCLTAHYRQALTLLRRMEEAEALWDRCDQLVRAKRLPDRCIGTLCDASRGWRFRRSMYIKSVKTSAGETITDATATRDLRAITEAGLLDPVGERRGRYYQPSDELRAVWASIRSVRPARGDDDPYSVVTGKAQPPLPGIS
jgi:Fic family protein